MLRSLMSVKGEVMDDASTIQKLTKVDVTEKSNLKNYNQIDVGFATNLKIKDLLAKKLVLEFRMECREMLQMIVARIVKKSPITYALVRNMSALDPSEIVKKDEDKSCDNFRRVLNVLHACKRVEIKMCDQIMEEYRLFVRSARQI